MTSVDHLIDQYWAGKATDSEKEQLYRHVLTLRSELSFDDFELFLDDVLTERAHKATTGKHARHLLYAIKEKTGMEEPAPAENGKFRKLSIAIAACIVAAIFIGLPWLSHHNNTAPREAAKISRLQKSLVPATKYISNNSGIVLDTVLPDHSSVSLFPNSSIAFPDELEPHARRVSMQGKVRFQVAKDKTRPFQVWAGGLITTAIGTLFEISTLNHNQTSVKLIEGKVSVKRIAQRNADSVMMEAGQNLVYLIGQNEIRWNDKITEVPAMKDKAELVFRDLPLTLVFKQMEEEFGVVIEYEAPVPDIRFSARFQKQAGAGKIIAEIAQQNKLTAEHTGSVYTIK